MIKTELYFGRHISPPPVPTESGVDLTGEGYVLDDEIREFLLDIVSPRFPGFTVLHGQGYWDGKPEDSFVVIILHENTSNDEDKIIDITEYYKRTYYQDSVLRVHYEAHTGF